MDKKELQTTSKNFLENIKAVYLANIEELQEYYPAHIKNKLDNLSNEAKKQIIKSGRRMTSGINSPIPMKCTGANCSLNSVCGLLKNGVEPTGFPCPYEELMVDKLTLEYYHSLDIDPFNRVERDQVRQMVELIIIDNRVSADIAEKGLYTLQCVGADNKGKALYNEVESIAYNIKLKTQSRLEKLQQELLATRKIKKQLSMDQPNDPSSKASNLYERFKKFKNDQIDDAKIEIIE